MFLYIPEVNFLAKRVLALICRGLYVLYRTIGPPNLVMEKFVIFLNNASYWGSEEKLHVQYRLGCATKMKRTWNFQCRI